MMLERWSTRTPLAAPFEARWREWGTHAPLANFALRIDHAEHEAAHGRHAILVLAEHRSRRLALVLREVDGELHCGWPWRWQAVMCDHDVTHGPHPDAGEALLMFQVAQAAAEGVRLRMHLPVDPGTRAPGARSGVTIVQRIDVSDEELLDSMDPSKRRLIRRATREGFEVRWGDRPEDRRRYGELDRAAARLRGETDVVPDGDPGPGERWREWELPWMRLLVAEREGCVEACVGDGVAPAAMADGRAAVTTPDARRSGVMSLLCHEEARLLRDSGHRWFNHGGDTVFKREVAGRLGKRLEMFVWMGGGRRYAIGNHLESLVARARPAVAAWVRAAGPALPRTPGRATQMTRMEVDRRQQLEAQQRRGVGRVLVRSWHTGEALDPSFARAWQRRLDESRRAHFALRTDYLKWQAERGNRAVAMLIDEPDLRVAVVMRKEHASWVCGWPWRPQILFEDVPERSTSVDSRALERVLHHLEAVLEPDRLRLFVPPVRPNPRGIVAGRTLLKPIALDDAALLASLDAEARRKIEQARAAGWSARLASGAVEWQGFHALQQERGSVRPSVDGPGMTADALAHEAWREWELPWHWLFVASRGEGVQAGAGFGWASPGIADLRAQAATARAEDDGVAALLAWVALQHARDAGCLWMNWGGTTGSRQSLGGDVFEVHAILGGGPLWAVPNRIEIAVHQSRRWLTDRARRLRQSRKGDPR